MGSFRQEQTFAVAELKDRLWSGAAAPPFYPADQVQRLAASISQAQVPSATTARSWHIAQIKPAQPFS